MVKAPLYLYRGPPGTFEAVTVYQEDLENILILII
jgi:hypothetical protein